MQKKGRKYKLRLLALALTLCAAGGCGRIGRDTEQGGAIENAVLYARAIYCDPEETQGENTVTITVDAVVVGGGLAGLSAATEIAEGGGSVIVVEKMPYVGGNALRSGGTMNAVDPQRQGLQGIEDSVELFIKNTYESGGMRGNPDLITILCEEASDAREWISAHGGLWDEGNVHLTAGGCWPRSLDAAQSTAETYIEPLAQAIVRAGGRIIRDMEAYSLLTDYYGRVVGVSARSTTSGKEYRLIGEKGIILATGGYGANLDMVWKYCAYIPRTIETETAPSATGDGIVMAQQLGAAVTDMDCVQMALTTAENGLFFTDEINNCIYVNQEGKRFVSEEADNSSLCRAILWQPDRRAYAIFDSNTIGEDFVDPSGWTVTEFAGLAEEGLAGYGETISELAESIGVDAEMLGATVLQFNRVVDGEAFDEFGRELFYKKLGDGPFYASIRTAKIRYTMGGLMIDTDARVLNEQGNFIEGLYACGEVTGGIHGMTLVSGNALTDCIVFGRLAGRNLLGGI